MTIPHSACIGILAKISLVSARENSRLTEGLPHLSEEYPTSITTISFDFTHISLSQWVAFHLSFAA